MKFVVFIVLMFFASANCQRISERMSIFNPLFNEDADIPGNELEWMTAISGWGEFGKYSFVTDAGHEWYQKLGMFFEFFRKGDKYSLIALGNIEFIADPNNEINFNPRAAFWEEGLLFTKRIYTDFWQVGYFHRCKHDIDNIETGEERSLIYGSILGKYIAPFTLPFGMLTVAVRGDLYTIRQDSRKAFEDVQPNLEYLISSTGINVNFKETLTEMFGVYINTNASIHLYGSEGGFFSRFNKLAKPGYNTGFEAGISITGNLKFKVGMRYEYLSDAGITMIPQGAHLLSIGLSLNPPEIR